MLKIFWEEATKRKSRIVSIILFPLILSASIILAIGYKIFLEFNNVLDTYESVFERWEHENNIS